MACRSELVAQVNRTNFVFHVYVDPIHGDDVLASNSHPGSVPPFNVSFTAAKEPLNSHPADATWTNLQHAPYSFRTVTAALTYLPTLPYVVPGSGDPALRVERVVIHCLPGVYGPTTGGAIDARSGLPFNGETFPINLPERVSIQGSGALQTTFDARGTNVGIFVLGAVAPMTENFAKVFIDGVTIRGARSNGNSNPPVGAGITIGGGTYVIRPNISNCMITDNRVGIAIEGSETIRHSPVIVNNTIAWNQVGVWNGEFAAPNTAPAVGYSMPRLFNNIIDARNRLGTAWGTATSAFEGLHDSDLRIRTIGANTVNIDYNAYATGSFNLGGALVPGFRPTAPRAATGTFVPRFDIAGMLRLYVSEAFWDFEGALQGPSVFANSRSPHDFRLAPLADNGPPGSMLNPMVNRGVDTSLGALGFDNSMPLITRAPGLQGPGSQAALNDTEFCSMHAWDWDCEGFGNARIAPRTGFAEPPANSTNIDLGADEMGRLIIAGFIERTRIFSRNVPDGSTSGILAIPDHTMPFFHDLPAPYGAGTYPMPHHSGYTGGRIPEDYRWWNWVQTTSGFLNNYSVYNYTRGEFPMYRNRDKTLSYPAAGTDNILWEPFMRNLQCDYAPTLLPDHKMWPQAVFNSGFPVLLPAGIDEFASNPWHHHFTTSVINGPYGLRGLYWYIDNHYIFFKPNHPTIPTAPIDGSLNPPATYVWGGVTPTGGYVGLFPNVQMFLLPTYTVGSTGVGAATLAVPDSLWLGVRYNCEVEDVGNFGLCNLQSFLAINGNTEPPISARSSAREPTALPRELDASHFEEMDKRGRAALQRQQR